MNENEQYLLGFFIFSFGGLLMSICSFFDIFLARVVFLSSLLITVIVISPLLGKREEVVRESKGAI